MSTAADQESNPVTHVISHEKFDGLYDKICQLLFHEESTEVVERSLRLAIRTFEHEDTGKSDILEELNTINMWVETEHLPSAGWNERFAAFLDLLLTGAPCVRKPGTIHTTEKVSAAGVFRMNSSLVDGIFRSGSCFAAQAGLNHVFFDMFVEGTPFEPPELKNHFLRPWECEHFQLFYRLLSKWLSHAPPENASTNVLVDVLLEHALWLVSQDAQLLNKLFHETRHIPREVFHGSALFSKEVTHKDIVLGLLNQQQQSKDLTALWAHRARSLEAVDSATVTVEDTGRILEEDFESLVEKSDSDKTSIWHRFCVPLGIVMRLDPVMLSQFMVNDQRICKKVIRCVSPESFAILEALLCVSRKVRNADAFANIAKTYFDEIVKLNIQKRASALRSLLEAIRKSSTGLPCTRHMLSQRDLPLSLKDMATSGPYDSRIVACEIVADLYDQGPLLAQFLRKEVSLSVHDDLKMAQRELFGILAFSAGTSDDLLVKSVKNYIKGCTTKIAQRPEGVILSHYLIRCQEVDCRLIAEFIDRRMFLKMYKSVKTLQNALSVIAFIFQENGEKLTEKEMSSLGDFIQLSAGHSSPAVRYDAASVLREISKLRNGWLLEKVWNMNLELRLNIPLCHTTIVNESSDRLMLWKTTTAEAFEKSKESAILSNEVIQGEINEYLSLSGTKSSQCAQEIFVKLFIKSFDSANAIPPCLVVVLAEALCASYSLSRTDFAKGRMLDNMEKCLCHLPSQAVSDVVYTLYTIFACCPADSLAAKFRASSQIVCARLACLLTTTQQDAFTEGISTSIIQCASECATSVSPSIVAECAILEDEGLLGAYLKLEHRNYLTDKFLYAEKFVDETMLSAATRQHIIAYVDRMGVDDAFYMKKLHQMTYNKIHLEGNVFAKLDHLLSLVGQMVAATNGRQFSTNLEKVVGAVLLILQTPRLCLPGIVKKTECILLSVIQGCCVDHSRFASLIFTRLIIHCTAKWMTPNFEESKMLIEKAVHSALQKLDWNLSKDSHLALLACVVPYFFASNDEASFERHLAAIGMDDQPGSTAVLPCHAEKQYDTTMVWLQKARPTRRYTFSHATQEQILRVVGEGFSSEEFSLSLPLFDALVHIALTEPVFSCEVADIVCQQSHRMARELFIHRVLALLFTSNTLLIRGALQCLNDTSFSLSPHLRIICGIGVNLCCYFREKEIAQLAQQISQSKGFELSDISIDQLLSLLLKVDEKSFMKLHPALAEIHKNAPAFIHQTAQYLIKKLHELRDCGMASRILAILNVSTWRSADTLPIIRALVVILEMDDSQLQSEVIACARNLVRRQEKDSVGCYHEEIAKHLRELCPSKQFRPFEAFYVILRCQAAIVLEDVEKMNESVQCIQGIGKQRVPMQFTKALGDVMSQIGKSSCIKNSLHIESWVSGLTRDLFSTELSAKQVLESALITVLVSLLSALGVTSISKYSIDEKIRNFQNAKGSLRIRALVLAKELHASFGFLFEPYVSFLKSSILEAIFDADGEVNHVAKDVLQSVIAGLTPIGTQQIIPALLLDFSKDSIRAKKDLMEFITRIALQNGAQTLTVLHMIIPVVVEHLSDTHETVAKKAVETLQRIVSLIPCEEVRDHIRRITAALQNPGCDTEDALDALLSARFRNSLDIASLSLILPIILRGIREKNVQIKLKSAQILSSITSILSDFSTLMEISAEVIELLVSTINEPLEAYQTSVALAVSSLLEHHEEDEQITYVGKFTTILTRIDVEPLQRTGAAKLLSELYRILPRANIDNFLQQIATRFMRLPVEARIGYLQLFTELSKRFLIQDTENVSIVIQLLLQSLPEELPELQSNVASVTRSLIRTNPLECANEMLQGLYKNLLGGAFNVRKRSFLLLVDMFHQVGGVQRDLIVSEEDSDGEDDPSPKSEENQGLSVDDSTSGSSGNNPDECYVTLKESIVEAMVHKVLACAYVMRLERDKEIKLQAITLWKSFVRNSHSFIKEISDDICAFVGSLYSSKEIEDVSLATQATKIILARLPQPSLERLFTTMVADLKTEKTHSFMGLTNLLAYVSDAYVEETYDSIEQIIISALRKPDDEAGTLVSLIEKLMSASTKQNVLEELIEKELTVIAHDDKCHIEGFLTLLRVRPKVVVHILFQKLEARPSGLSIVHIRLLGFVLKEATLEDILPKVLVRTIKLLLRSPESLLEFESEITDVFMFICVKCWSSRQEVLSFIGDGGDSRDSNVSKELRLAFLSNLGKMSIMHADAEMLVDILTNLTCQFSAQDVDYIHLVQNTLISVRDEIQSNESELQPLYQYTSCIDGCLRTTYQGSLLGNAGKFLAINSVYGLHTVLPFYTNAIVEGPTRTRDDALEGLSFLLSVVDKEVVSTIWPRVAGEILFLMIQEDFSTGEFIRFLTENIPRVSQRSFEIHAATIVTLLFDICLTHTSRTIREDAICLAFICNQHCVSEQLVLLAFKSAELAFARSENLHPLVLSSICRGIILFIKNAREKVNERYVRPLLVLLDQFSFEHSQPIASLHKLKGLLTAHIGDDFDMSSDTDERTSIKSLCFLEGYVTGSLRSEVSNENLKIGIAMCQSVLSRPSSACKETTSPRTIAFRILCECIHLAHDAPTEASLWSLAVELASVDSEPTIDENHSPKVVYSRILQKAHRDHRKHNTVDTVPVHAREAIRPNAGKSKAHESMPDDIPYIYDAEVEDEHTNEC